MDINLLRIITNITDNDIKSLTNEWYGASYSFTQVNFHEIEWINAHTICVNLKDGFYLQFSWGQAGPDVLCRYRKCQGICKHFVEVVYAIGSLLKFETGRLPENLRDKSKLFRNQILGGTHVSEAFKQPEGKLSIHVTATYPYKTASNLDLHFECYGLKRKYNNFNNLPPAEFKPLFKDGYVTDYNLIKFVEKNPNYDYYLHASNQKYLVDFDVSAKLSPKTQIAFGALDDKIHFIGEYKSEVISDLIRLSDKLFASVQHKTIGIIQDNWYKENWNKLFHLKYNYNLKRAFSSPTTFLFSPTKRHYLENFIFSFEGSKIEPKPDELKLKVLANIIEGQVRLKVAIEGVQESSQTIFGSDLSSFIGAYVDKFRKLHKKEKDICISVGHGAILAKNNHDLIEVLKAAQKQLLEIKDHSNHKDLLSFYSKKYQEINKPPLNSLLLAKNNSLIYGPISKVKAFMPMSAAYFSFKSYRYSNDNVILIDKADFFANLAQYKNYLDEQGIELFIDGKSVKVSNINATIDAEREFFSPDIDWFEIKPEIMYDGEPISDEEWESIMTSGSVFQRGDTYHVVDTGSKLMLDVLARILKIGSKFKKKKDIVEIPRLQIFDLIELLAQGVRVKLSAEDRKILDNLTNFTKIEPAKLPTKLNANLRDYQKSGYDWLAFLYKNKFGACLADEMGLGKTIQAISLLAGIKEGEVRKEKQECKPHLVVSPPSLTFNWCNELQKFYPSFKINEYTGAKRADDFEDCDIVVTSYETARNDIEKLKQKNFDVIVFDEAQAIKNISAKKTSAVRQLVGDFKLTLTGTPLENSLAEYYSIMDISVPGILPESAHQVKVNINDAGHQNIIKRTRPFILRRTKSEILKELPEKSENDIYFSMTTRQKALYNKIVTEIRRTVESAYKEKTAYQASIIALTAILRLRQICVSPNIIDNNAQVDSPKIEYLVDAISNLIKSGDAALIFSQFIGSLDIIERELAANGIKVLRIDGSTAMPRRKEIVEQFQDKKTVSVLLLSLKVGGVGLNLTRANHVFHVDPWWNPAVENQASDRAHRIGQSQKVFVHRLLMHHSIEEKMMVLKEHKKKLFDSVMSGAADKSVSITKEDFEFLLS